MAAELMLKKKIPYILLKWADSLNNTIFLKFIAFFKIILDSD